MSPQLNHGVDVDEHYETLTAENITSYKHGDFVSSEKIKSDLLMSPGLLWSWGTTRDYASGLAMIPLCDTMNISNSLDSLVMSANLDNREWKEIQASAQGSDVTSFIANSRKYDVYIDRERRVLVLV